MIELLEALLTFVGIMLLLALAAQSLQELVKSGFALKSMAARAALDGLIVEASRATGHLEGEGKAIAAAVVRRLRGLGQSGLRPDAIRLDKLDAAGVESLIRSVRNGDLQVAIGNLPPDALQKELDAIGAKAREWFALSSDPVDDRYVRRMRYLSLLTSLIVVVTVNANAIYILQAVQRPEYRAAAAPMIQAQDSLYRLYREARADSTQRPRADSLWSILDANSASLARAATENKAFTIGDPGGRRWRDPEWLLGILLAALLVSMGAPFWHDMLESVMGFKNRLRAQAEAASAVASGGVTVSASTSVTTPAGRPAAPAPPAQPGPQRPARSNPALRGQGATNEDQANEEG